MTSSQSYPPLEPYVVVALRNEDGVGWRLLSLDCAPEGVDGALLGLGLEGAEYRQIGSGDCMRVVKDAVAEEAALHRGWNRSRVLKGWVPIDERLPLLAAEPQLGRLSLRLVSITNGWIHVAVDAGEAAFDLSFDDVGDSMVLLARFVQIMVAGGEPHAPLAENGRATFVVNHHGTGVCRFHLISRPHAFMPEGHGGMIDMLVDRDELTEQFRALTNAIADHPNFAHHYVCHGELPEEEYNRVDLLAETEWKAGQAEGRFPDDWWMENEFVAAAISAAVPLPAACAEAAEKERSMLRSLEIPEEWMLGDGMASQWVGRRKRQPQLRVVG
ncbi:hypothetical protein [Xanthobacter sp.]|uniref:hypothetical protein n=1 Tax=Xanthobacter sp. TaxID=35809 RepID=UPI0035B4B6E3